MLVGTGAQGLLKCKHTALRRDESLGVFEHPVVNAIHYGAKLMIPGLVRWASVRVEVWCGSGGRGPGGEVCL
jgi:hypothetical protein